MPNLPVLLPNPRQLELTGGFCELNDKKLILLENNQPQVLLFSAIRLQSWIQANFGLTFELHAGENTGLENVAIVLRMLTERRQKPQGYHLHIGHTSILIEAVDEVGIFYACCTLI
ncbi:MAG TPA: glycoside hydrolase family 20 zincin-like fold domain-containing protein, partial [Anaerolineales bacterium]|nr:glycoside hydrolase family 20 zincin-like fold domain-containing protein [Anaerolineales bacterium]